MEGYIAIIFVVILLGIWIFFDKKGISDRVRKRKQNIRIPNIFLKHKCFILQVTPETGK